MTTKTTTRSIIFFFFALFFLSPFFSTAQFLPPGRADFLSEYSGVDISNKEWVGSDKGWAFTDWIGKPELWKTNEGQFKTGKFYKGTIKNPASLIEMPGGEKLKGIVGKGDLAVIRFNPKGEMELYFPKPKYKMALLGDAKNETIKFKEPPVKL
ncbi:MAG: hypothetical protein HN778_16175 [Prolixibacteraceae bacterium]|jgi:hypothetical protein|nr:hypothetical protein [Prolixibacteraceae bacterium]MBT6999272.1 hypothetical protein [Prolixibacteraceae bacterium]MBT7396365.1 hypothetical protein [Prolixibacteraceae bacterium]